MTVELQLANFTASQGYASDGDPVYLTNSGDENTENIYMKVVDSEVFVKLRTKVGFSYYDCLNVFCGAYVRFNDLNPGGSHFVLPAGASKRIPFDLEIKSDAPIQDHPLVCYWQYRVY